MPVRDFESPLLVETEHRVLFLDSNDTARGLPRDCCVHQLFEEQVSRTPDATAVIFEGERTSYRDLNARANRLARHLRGLGVREESLVALLADRSLEALVGLLGILKAGGAYLPLDPIYPGDRLAYMLQQSRASVLLTERRLLALLPKRDVMTVFLDDSCPGGAEEEQDLFCRTTHENLAYVMYTSGSTGRPKGVAMPHGPLVNLISWQLGKSKAGVGTKTLQFTSLGFDVSFQELFSTWCSGGALVVASESLRRDPDALLRLLNTEGVGRLFVPFVALQQMAEAASKNENMTPRNLQEIITAGEQLRITPALARFVERCGNCTLINQYGPTECHVVTAFKLNDRPSTWETLPPIGRPIANVRICIFDSGFHSVPVGVAGELYIGGDCLARGYLNFDDLTAERFVRDPSSPETEQRLYKTGDLARWRSDGNIEFLGRIDQQLKVRGYRIELGEIEAVLGEHPDVRDAVAVARNRDDGNVVLVGYFVPRAGRPPKINELCRHLRKKLPDYMVPSAFVRLERLPLTPNGKVDRLALPPPDRSRPDLETGYVAPRTELEEQLAAIWAEFLGMEQVGIHDSFFDFGGHSLLAIQMAARVEKSFGTTLPPLAVFRRPTVEQFALGLHNPTDFRSAGAVLEIQPKGSKPPLFFLPSITGQAEYLPSLLKHLGPDQPVLGIGFPDPQQPPHPFATLEDIAKWCVEKILEARPVGPYSLAGYSFSGMLAYEVACQLRAKGGDVRLVAILDEGPRPKKTLGRLLRYPRLVLTNVPFWIAEVVLSASLRENVARVRRAIKTRMRALGVSGEVGTSHVSVDSIWDVGEIAPATKEVMENNLRLFFAYVPKPYPGGIMLFRARARPLLHSLDRDLGWGNLAAGGVEIIDLPGSHDNLLSESSMRRVAKRLVERLDRSA
jgi:amino acid adenylation domain-containing protein